MPRAGVRHAHEAEHRAELLVRQRLLGDDERERREEDARAGGHADPGLSAIVAASLPTSVDVERARRGRGARATASRSSGVEHVAAVPLQLLDEARRRRAPPTITHDSLVQRIELSKLFESTIRLRAAVARSAVCVDQTGTLPGPDADRRVTRASRRRAPPPCRRWRRSRRSSVGSSAPRSAGSSGSSTTWTSRPARRRLRRPGERAARRRRDTSSAERVRADDDRVAGHQREQHLEVRPWRRVGRRRQREDDAGRPRNLDDLASGVDPALTKSRRRVVLDDARASRPRS